MIEYKDLSNPIANPIAKMDERDFLEYVIASLSKIRECQNFILKMQLQDELLRDCKARTGLDN